MASNQRAFRGRRDDRAGRRRRPARPARTTPRPRAACWLRRAPTRQPRSRRRCAAAAVAGRVRIGTVDARRAGRARSRVATVSRPCGDLSQNGINSGLLVKLLRKLRSSQIAGTADARATSTRDEQDRRHPLRQARCSTSPSRRRRSRADRAASSTQFADLVRRSIRCSRRCCSIRGAGAAQARGRRPICSRAANVSPIVVEAAALLAERDRLGARCRSCSRPTASGCSTTGTSCAPR